MPFHTPSTNVYRTPVVTSTALSAATKHHVRHVVGSLHASESGVAVVRALYRRMAGIPHVWQHKRVRKAVYRYALKVHADNRKLYHTVMRGF